MFVAFYLGESRGNAADAARRAGYRETRVRPTRLLAKASIQAEISAAVTSAAMSATEVLARISDIASGSLGDFIDVGGPLWNVNLERAKKRGKMHLLKKIKSTKEGTEVEIHAPLDALKTLAQYHGLLKDKQEIALKHDDDSNTPILVYPAGRAELPGQDDPSAPRTTGGAAT